MYAIVSQCRQWYNDIYKAYFPRVYSQIIIPTNTAITVLISTLEVRQGL